MIAFLSLLRRAAVRGLLSVAILLILGLPGGAEFSAAAAARLRLHEVFADHVVLQREQPVRIWGWGAPGEKVTVTFAGQSIAAMVDKEGAWQVELKPLQASAEGRDFIVRSGEEAVTVRDVAVGEVWLASGQSNMAMTVGDVAKQLPEVEKQVASYELGNIRFCRMNQGDAAAPQQHLSGNTTWTPCTPATARGFSAAAFFFARKLQEELKVPIGMIDSSRGGTPIEPYIPRDAFNGHPTLVREGELGDAQDLKGLTELPGGVFARDANWLPGRLFNSRLAPISNYPVRGAIWYQGESNCGTGEDPRDYQHKMRALVKGWRKAFQNENLPVYYVQLPGSGAGERWPYLREQQRLSMDLPHTGMAVTVDLVGGDIHPPNKVDVGERLAAWALAKTYDQSLPFSGPLFKKADIHGDRLIVHFDYADAGLMVASKQGLAPPQETPDAPLALFELTDDSGTWHAAEAKIDGQTILVQSAEVKQPRAVRYGYRKTPDACNLYSRAGLPAAPFCSAPERLRFDGP